MCLPNCSHCRAGDFLYKYKKPVSIILRKKAQAPKKSPFNIFFPDSPPKLPLDASKSPQKKRGGWLQGELLRKRTTGVL